MIDGHVLSGDVAVHCETTADAKWYQSVKFFHATRLVPPGLQRHDWYFNGVVTFKG